MNHHRVSSRSTVAAQKVVNLKIDALLKSSLSCLHTDLRTKWKDWGEKDESGRAGSSKRDVDRGRWQGGKWGDRGGGWEIKIESDTEREEESVNVDKTGERQGEVRGRGQKWNAEGWREQRLEGWMLIGKDRGRERVMQPEKIRRMGCGREGAEEVKESVLSRDSQGQKYFKH